MKTWRMKASLQSSMYTTDTSYLTADPANGEGGGGGREGLQSMSGLGVALGEAVPSGTSSSNPFGLGISSPHSQRSPSSSVSQQTMSLIVDTYVYSYRHLF